MPAAKKAVPTQVATKADCVTAMEGLKYRPELLICDPPYNFGMPYDAYKDSKSHTEYLAWTRKWVGTAAAVLDPHGALWIFAPDEWVSEIDVMAKREFKLYKRQHVIWAFTFGQKCSKKFTRSHCHLLHLTKSKTKFTFNADALKVPSARQLVYKDKRAVSSGKLPDDTWMLLESQMRPFMGRDRDVWLESRICGTFKERKKHSPNQIPVPVMERIVLACSDEGERVVDPFAGTCSSAIPCVRHGRNWEGFDLSRTCVTAGNKRIAQERARLGL